MTKCLMSWHVFDFMTNGLTSWHIFYFRTNCLHHDVYLTLWLFGLMTNPLTRFVSSWHNSSLFWEQNIMKTCFWCYSELMSYHVFDVMTNFFEVMAYFWHTFWHHNIVFLTLFLNIWRIFDVMTNLLTPWPVFDIITCFWRHDKLCIQIYQNDDVVRLLRRYHVCPKAYTQPLSH